MWNFQNVGHIDTVYGACVKYQAKNAKNAIFLSLLQDPQNACLTRLGQK